MRPNNGVSTTPFRKESDSMLRHLTKLLSMMLVVLLALTLVAGCTPEEPPAEPDGQAEAPTEEPEPEEEGPTQLRIGMFSSPETFNVTRSTGYYSHRAMDIITGTLVRWRNDQTFEGYAAESWDISDDKRTYTFHLRDDLYWHDGEPVVADDFRVTYEFLCNPDSYGLLIGRLNVIEGAQEYFDGEADEITGIEVVDDKTLKITTVEPSVTLLESLMYPTIPSHILGNVAPEDLENHDFWQHPLGFGPYKFVEYKTDQYIRMEKYSDFIFGEPKIDEVVIRIASQDSLVAMLQRGELDFIPVPATEANRLKEEGGDFEIYTSHSGSVQLLHVNTERSYLSDTRVRKGLMYAINRQGMAESLYDGYAMVFNMNRMPPWVDTSGYIEYTYDPDKAKALLDEAGWHSNQEIILRVPTGNKPRERMGPVLHQNFADVGVNAEVVMSDFTTVTNLLRAGDYDLGIQGWTTGGDPDILSIVHHSASIPPAGYNLSRYVNPKVDALLEEGRSTYDQDKRAEIYKEFGEIINDELPIIPMVAEDDIFGVTTAVKGFEPRGFDNYGNPCDLYNIWEWEITE